MLGSLFRGPSASEAGAATTQGGIQGGIEVDLNYDDSNIRRFRVPVLQLAWVV
jgi:hypothetical protein